MRSTNQNGDFVSVRRSYDFLKNYWSSFFLSDQFPTSLKCRPHTGAESEMFTAYWTGTYEFLSTL